MRDHLKGFLEVHLLTLSGGVVTPASVLVAIGILL
jgi:hypothetical protein